MTVIDASTPESRAGALPLVAGVLALDFANTESGRGSASHQDHLREAAHVAAWLAHARVVAPEEADWLRAASAARPDLAGALLARARTLREAIGEIFRAVALGAAAPPRQLAELTAFQAEALGRATLAPVDGRYAWRWRLNETPIEAALGPIALSAVGLLSEGDLKRVKPCDGVACGWLFLDQTKNQRRRWCEMEVCGNRAKQRRRAARARAA